MDPIHVHISEIDGSRPIDLSTLKVLSASLQDYLTSCAQIVTEDPVELDLPITVKHGSFVLFVGVKVARALDDIGAKVQTAATDLLSNWSNENSHLAQLGRRGRQAAQTLARLGTEFDLHIDSVPIGHELALKIEESRIKPMKSIGTAYGTLTKIQLEKRVNFYLSTHNQDRLVHCVTNDANVRGQLVEAWHKPVEVFGEMLVSGEGEGILKVQAERLSITKDRESSRLSTKFGTWKEDPEALQKIREIRDAWDSVG